MDEQQRPLPDDFFKDWKEREALAEGMIPLIGKLYREYNINTYMYGNSMVNQSVTDLMKEHRFVRQVENNELSEFDTYPMLEGISKLKLGPAHIDVGKLVVKYQNSNENGSSLSDFLSAELDEIIGSDVKPLPEPQDVVLYGFGRIGRLIARILVDKAGGGDVLRLRAIVIRKGKLNHDLEKRAALLRRDSVHGPFKGTVRVLEDKNILVVNGNPIKIIYANSPEEIDYNDYGITNALIVDNTGVWKDTEGLSGHLRPGASKVLLTAPAGDDIPNIVYGVNHDQITLDRKIISAASCTTNAIVPVLKCLLDEFGINGGHVETVHAYTNDQNLIDNYHKGGRRGRSAALNMVLTSTGAAKAVAKVIPELKGKLTGNAIRVPTPNVSMAILNLQLGRDTTVEELNEFLRQKALHSDLQQQIGYTISTEAVSTDFVGSRQACVIDAQATIVEGRSCVLYCWYDNEFGYSCQVVRCLEKFAGVVWPSYPREA
ncbi:MAG: glyceraldehyde-3-phosphate dehydrogenase [Porticoccaceae bacterium]|nr:glyceraldehyde-3-phosphate dehydrogenase [Porticoccaceae bacterium]MBT3798299.1 glyceraldehyde-3-phosphate dehydrogenase [Porticoccaceae bacterium]MBT4212203.1 glyceraldehyde-3-phosphate dehydrogenase [Porticoccaceae bacterium]MBT5104321.1 glyceraldehyde-3-phosphate dehydrogenase [Porticoccaceae bacterium]MBT6026519.1 glyceraldehyde-3-phosphate dehydrogenase [Porticoccaceae bacterium]